MKTIVTNNYNLTDKDITEVVKRVKVLLVNSKNEILLAYSHNEYQFPGGHVEEGEELTDTVKREIKEETGLDLDVSSKVPFACSIGYWKDWPEEGKNRKTEIYYFEIPCDQEPNLEKIKLTKNEKEGNFTLKYIPIETIEEEITNNSNTYGDKHGIAKEMLELLYVYKYSIKQMKTKGNNHSSGLLLDFAIAAAYGIFLYFLMRLGYRYLIRSRFFWMFINFINIPIIWGYLICSLLGKKTIGHRIVEKKNGN